MAFGLVELSGVWGSDEFNSFFVYPTFVLERTELFWFFGSNLTS